MDQIFWLCRVFERWIRSRQKFVAIFIDFLAAFDKVHCESMWNGMLVNGIPAKIVNVLCNYYEGAECSVWVYSEFTNSFNITTCIWQGSILSPMINNIIIDCIVNRAGASPFVVGKNLLVHSLDYADDIALLADSITAGQMFLDNVASAAAKLGLRIIGLKTKVVSFEHDAPMIWSPLMALHFKLCLPSSTFSLFMAIPLHLLLWWNAESAKHLVSLLDLRRVSGNDATSV